MYLCSVKLKKLLPVRSILCFILGLSIILNGCASTSGMNSTQSAAQQQDQQEATEIIGVTVGTLAFITVVCVLIASANAKKAKAKAKAEEDKFQACVGKTKAEIYTIYGPPDSIVDDAQNDGGTILIYQTITTSGGSDDSSVETTTHRKLFYVNKNNIVTSVKEDSH
jgi:hypothetical protein